MLKITNENILKLVFTNLNLLQAYHLLNQMNNLTLHRIVQSLLSYKAIFKSLGKAKFTLNEDSKRTTSIALQSGNHIVSASVRGMIHIWNINDQQCIKTLQGEFSIDSVIVIPNNIIVTSSKDNIKIWDSNDDYKCIKIILHASYKYYKNLLTLTNGNLACSATVNETAHILIFDCSNDFKCIKILTNDSLYISNLIKLSNDRIAYCYSSTRIKIKSTIDDFQDIITLIGHKNWINTLAFVNKYGLLLSGSHDDIIKVWNLSAYQCIKTIPVWGGVYKLLSLPGGYFASGHFYDGVIRIWDMSNYECINILEGHGKGCPVSSLSLTEDNRIVSVSNDKAIVIWNY
jgi:WD40 repeat protein